MGPVAKLCFSLICLIIILVGSFTTTPLIYYLTLGQLETECLLLNKSYSYQNISDVNLPNSPTGSCGPALNLVLSYSVYLTEYGGSYTVCGQDRTKVACCNNSECITDVNFYKNSCPPLIALNLEDYDSRNISNIYKCWYVGNKNIVVWEEEYVPYTTIEIFFTLIIGWVIMSIGLIICEIRRKKREHSRVVSDQDFSTRDQIKLTIEEVKRRKKGYNKVKDDECRLEKDDDMEILDEEVHT